ncbi:MAG: ribosome assembly factor SBDS [Candidatus Aenigmarchaeota archaeon]|nr:ribosome assembly factor SBDS [Candidatus Aenigmarchaeota archaeon]
MVSLDKAVIAKIHRTKEFQILVDPDLALNFKKGKPGSIDNILAVRGIFNDARKGDHAPDSDLTKAFGTTDVVKIAEVILRDGELQLTTEQRRTMVEEKRKQLATLISRQAIDPKTRLPHPPQRIMNAMEQAKVSIDPFKSAEAQLEEILKKLEPIIPLRMERLQIAVHVPMESAGRASSIIRTIAQLKEEEWRGDGWYALLEIPAGMQGDIYAKINDLTHGKADVKVMEKR